MAKGKNEALLRSKDVAHILDMSPDDVVGLGRGGELKATKQGRYWLFRPSDAMAYKKQMNKKT
jgi:hypothetical protein